MKYLLSLIISGALVVSGFGQTRNVLVGTNNAVVQPTNFWSADAVNARSGLGLGTAATNPASAFQPSSAVLSNLAAGSGIAITNISASNIVGAVAVVNGGTGATNAGGARTNLELGASWLTNTNVTNFRTAIGLGATNDVFFDEIDARYISIEDGGSGVVVSSSSISFFGTNVATIRSVTRTNLGLGSTDSVTFGPAILSKLNLSNSSIDIGATSPTTVDLTYIGVPLLSVGLSGVSFGSTSFAAVTRTNLGLGWPALTNSNAGTGLVSVSTNGEVVSPTNFWQVAPIVTRFVESQPTTNQTTNITAARNLHIHSLAISTVGVTNTIALPTTNSFNGDIALVVHQGPTSSVTAVRTAGAGTNLVTLNQFDEAVEFVYYNNVWQFNHNRSFIEPIYFSGTNAAANAAASRTNLGLGNIFTNVVSIFNSNTAVFVNTNFTATNGTGLFTNLQTQYLEFGDYLFVADTTNTNVIVFEDPSDRTNFIRGLGLGPTNNVQFSQVTIGNDTIVDGVNIKWGGNDRIELETKLFLGGDWTFDDGAINVSGETNKAITRTNLGLGGTNSVTFSSLTLSSDLTFGSGDNIVLSTTNGTKIGTATNQLLGFYNQTPVAQPSTTGVTTNGFTGGGGGNTVHAQSTFTGGIGTNAYTIGDIVAHLKSLGLIAE
jgi:hypothetical protein